MKKKDKIDDSYDLEPRGYSGKRRGAGDSVYTLKTAVDVTISVFSTPRIPKVRWF